MKITNKAKCPEPFYRAILNDSYNNGGSDFTATSLANPPRATALFKAFSEEIEIEAHTRTQSLIGQSVHFLAERAARKGVDIVEKRYFAYFNVDDTNYVVSGQIDLFEPDTGILYDWKSTKTYAFHQRTGGGQKPEYIQQMNVCLHLMRMNGLDAKSLRIIALLKDWDEKKAQADAGYPQIEVFEVDIPIWPTMKTISYIEERIRLHVKARHFLPNCSKEDTWNGRRCERWCDSSTKCEPYLKTKRGI